MSVLVVGLSHRTAPVRLLEQVALTGDAPSQLAAAVLAGECVTETVVLATCNRIEIYADVSKFHGGVDHITAAIAEVTGVPLDVVSPHLYAQYEDGAVEHLFTVACGLDSMVVGESQILGQVKATLRDGQSHGTAGRVLNELFQHALRVGKRAHTETMIDRAGQSIVTVGLDLAEEHVGDLTGRRAVIVGAGSMAALSAASLRRRGIADITVLNRTLEHAERLAAASDGRAGALADLAEELRGADVLVSCTGAIGTVIAADTVVAGRAGLPDAPLAVLDLALPHDVDPAVGALAGVSVVDLELLAARLDGTADAPDTEAVRSIVAEEVVAFLGWQRASSVAPTVTALRTMAAHVVDSELERLSGRLPDLTERERAEVEQAVRRVVDKLLHAPTVRVKELAVAPGGHAYADALRELFDLGPDVVKAVTRPAMLEETAVAPRGIA